ncbi:MAG: hypothetical protein A2Y76_04140 [Planctomycetes bacterium RBG_13_60_9]|nr:MAG: hypothetical protein A2Y76_04140 [Planctomycetes bacterium RBG_13_60_9]
MANASCEIRIGTSGWHYKHWLGRFYPEKLPKDKWLAHYAQHFDTVEINNTFYHLPREQTMLNWHDRVPANFLFAVKANRYITHVKKLKDPAETLHRFFDLANLLEEHLGPVLYQLPPSLHKNLERLDEFIGALPKRELAVFEFRHSSWYEQDTFDLLNRWGVALCVHDMGDRAPPRIMTGRMVYVRFHGTSAHYAGNYPDSLLHDWANWMKSQMSTARVIYAYFNNDISGHAVNNARTLKQIMGI